MKTYGVVDVKLHVFWTSALDGDGKLHSRSGSFNPGESVPVVPI